jgi:hypothetical protein
MHFMKIQIRPSVFGPFWLAFASAVVIVASSRAAESGRPDAEGIENQVQAARAVVEDELAQEQQLRSVQRELQELLDTTNQQVEELGGERVPDHPMVKVHTQIIALRAAIESRLPPTESGAGSPRRVAFPVPTYSDKKIVGKAANQLWAAQTKLADCLRQSPDDGEQSQELLVDMILAEENLAWEVGWPFTAEEAASVKKTGQVTGEVYLGRRSRGVKRVNEDLARHYQSVGREPAGAGFVIHSPDSKAIQRAIRERLAELRGEAAARVWMKGTQTLDERQMRQPDAGKCSGA